MTIHFKQLPDLRWILPVSMVTRLIAILLKHPGYPPGWGGEMVSVANSIASGHGFASPYVIETGPTAFVPPVYPYFLSIFFKLFGTNSTTAGAAALGMNIVFSALVIIPLFFLTQSLFNRRAALLAAWVWAMLPLGGYTDALFIWNTSLYALALTTSLAVTLSFDKTDSRTFPIRYGALAGFTILVDPASLTVVGLSCLWLIRERINSRTLLAVLMATFLLPSIWVVRNSLVFHKPVFLRSNFSLEISSGIRNFELEGGRPESLPNRNPDELEKFKNMGELDYMQYRMDEAMEWIKDHPLEYSRRAGRRIVAFWTGYKVSEIYLFYGRFELLKRLFYSLPAFGAFLSLFFLKERERFLILSILLFYPVVYYITHTDLRYRLPIEPLLIGLTAGAICTVYEKYKTSR